jgi:hypothetical protein
MRRVRAVASVLGLASAFTAPAAWAHVAGAIYTTVSDGTEVNFNIYQAKEDVYLNGGPGKGAGSPSPGLVPDGTYVFMVTDPSGKTLLSTDPAECRLVTVSGGVITDTTGTCPHVEGATSGGYATVQLFPYLDTPNQGGEYKVWLTPLASYACDDLSLVDCPNGTHGFIHSESKTDNFKVKGIADEIDTRFYDVNGNILDYRRITWLDSLGASNTKWSYFDPNHWVLHEAHVEAPEIGTHYIKIENQPGCTVGKVFVDNLKTKASGPQTVPVRITKAMKAKGTFTVFVDVMCINTN